MATRAAGEDWAVDEAFWITTQPFEYDLPRLEGTPGEVDRLEALLGIEPPARILDVGCGPGRHALEFARRGYRVVGIDRTRGFISQARDAAEAANLDVDFIAADARDFRRPNSFDGALSLFTTVGYNEAEDDAVMLRNVRISLAAGRLVVDTINRALFAGQSRVESKKAVAGRTLTETSAVTADGRYLDTQWTIDSDDQDDGPSMFRTRLRLYTAAELEAMLRDAGFTRCAVYGSLDGDDHDEGAPRTVIVATA